MFFYLFPIRKKVALHNLALCYPEKDIYWKNNIIKESYINLGINMLEFLYIPKLNKECLSKFVNFNNTDLIDKARSENKGTFFLSGHFSNWELCAFAYPALTDDSMHIIAKVQASRGLNKKINEYRELSGNKIIEIGFSLKEIFSLLKKNRVVTFLIDQSAHPDYSSYVNFFGKLVPAFSGPAKIALRQRPQLIIAYGLREIDYSYKIYFENICYADLIENSDENVIALTQRIQSKMEEVIRKCPGQWLWLHKRFKHIKNNKQPENPDQLLT
ncbi:MAG: lysophospholipid acyltransferase family protein [Bacteroidota bacterium]|nr:lysophospholipid acyltransferase family protein [Bacteroidota bacterium]